MRLETSASPSYPSVSPKRKNRPSARHEPKRGQVRRKSPLKRDCPQRVKFSRREPVAFLGKKKKKELCTEVEIGGRERGEKFKHLNRVERTGRGTEEVIRSPRRARVES